MLKSFLKIFCGIKKRLYLCVTCLPRFPLEQRAQGKPFIFYTVMSKIPYTKHFLSYAAQLSLLKSRGMVFSDETKVLHLLEKIGYYRLSGYWYPLLANKEKHIFKPNANFETAFSLYKFDRELRKLVNAEIEKIEVAIRAKMTYELSLAYNPFWIENDSLFAFSQNYLATLGKINEEYTRSNEEFIIAFKNKYSNPLPPSCVILEITSFGTLSRLYRNLKPSKAKRNVAKSFALPDIVFDSWLHSLACVRNMCAHHARLWNSLIKIQPLSPRNPQNIWLIDNSTHSKRVYYVFSMIIYLLNVINPNHTFKHKLEKLFAKYPNVNRTAMGFPANWQNEPLWQ
jgi:abortive infection bacteriophage resistance protein